MPAPSNWQSAHRSVAGLKVFISYSRKDSEFARDLLSALELLGFDAYLDQQDIDPGEDWQKRLESLIQTADTVVFVLSVNSLASKHCVWELDESVRSGKRLVPIVLKKLPDTEIPERLSKLNYVFFLEGKSFFEGLNDLARALRADAAWIREHSRYADMAARWAERGEADSLLLRGSDLDEAKQWMLERPQNAPEISARQLAFVEASSKTASNEIAAKLKLRWRILVGLACATIAMAGLSAISAFLWQSAETAKIGLVDKNKELDAANARLERKLALRAAPLGETPYDVPAGWFQVATSYAGAVAFVERVKEPNGLIASGAIVNALSLNAGWTSQPVFVTATYVVADSGSSSPFPLRPTDAMLVFFGPRNERHTARLGSILWQSDRLGLSISTIDGSLPEGVTMIEKIEESPAALAQLISITRAEIDAMSDSEAMRRFPGAPRPIIFVGNLAGRHEVALSISHLIGFLNSTDSLSHGVARALSPASVSMASDPDLVYTHGTLPGGGGSPIFDAETGALIGIHLAGYPCPGKNEAKRQGTGGGVSITQILAAIRADPQGKSEPVNPPSPISRPKP